MVDSESAYPDDSATASSTPWRDTSIAKGMKAGGKSMSQAGNKMIDDAREQAAAGANRQQPLNLPSYRKGGTVRKTGPALVHKGEKVIPRKKVRKHTRSKRRSREA